MSGTFPWNMPIIPDCWQIISRTIDQSVLEWIGGIQDTQLLGFIDRLFFLKVFFYFIFCFLVYYFWKSEKDQKRDEQSVHVTDFEKCRSKGLHSLNFKWLLRRKLMNFMVFWKTILKFICINLIDVVQYDSFLSLKMILFSL